MEPGCRACEGLQPEAEINVIQAAELRCFESLSRQTKSRARASNWSGMEWHGPGFVPPCGPWLARSALRTHISSGASSPTLRRLALSCNFSRLLASKTRCMGPFAQVPGQFDSRMVGLAWVPQITQSAPQTKMSSQVLEQLLFSGVLEAAGTLTR